MYLNTHSCFSFKYGVMHIKELLKEAQKNNINKFVLTDINSTAGCLRFVRDAPKYNIKPILGVDIRNDVKQEFIAIARNNQGFYEINQFISLHLHNKTPFPTRAPILNNTYIIYPFSSRIKHLRPYEYIGVTSQELLHIPFSYWKNQTDKLVILHSVSFRYQRNVIARRQVDFNIHKILRAIDNNTLLSKLTEDDLGELSHHMLRKNKLLDNYQDYPQIIKNTKKIIEDSSINLAFGTQYPHKNIKSYLATPEADYKLLRKKALAGIPYRYPSPNIKIYRRIAQELKIIKQKNFVSYFLINWDIINYALNKKYFYVGRGSGANSIIAYLLRITDVDPIELDLYFERFINLYRENPPDFDIDFSWRDREDITQYIFQKFTPEKTALLATYSSFKFKAAIREVSKVCGLPPHEIDLLSNMDKDTYNQNTYKTDDITKTILHYAQKLDGLPSHLSVHASGIIIAEKPIHNYTATSLPPKGFPITHFDMTEAEDLGLYKFDILSQRGLSKIKDTLEIIKENNPDHPNIDIHDVKRFFEDNRVKNLLRNGQAIGCFYVESPAMRMLLKKLRADHYLGLVAASSIIRPGVAKSGMMREYILRFRQPQRQKKAHPILLDLMPDTFGVMVYQEDVIKVAHYFAGLSLAEADKLRRGMSGKYRSRTEFKEVERRYFEQCSKKGHSEKLAKEVWLQIISFAGYAFAKGHSASYAIESYQCLYLKAHYPLEYMVSVINNGGGFYGVELYLHEARMQGAIIEAPCVNQSQNISIIKGKTIILGLNSINSLEKNTINKLISKRSVLGYFQSLEELTDIIDISLEELKILIRVGGCRTIHSNKKKLLWDAHFLISKKSKIKLPSLFKTQNKKIKLPKLYYDTREDGFDEMEILNFSLKSPFSLIQQHSSKNVICAKNINQYINKTITMLGYLVAIKNTRTSKNTRMYFGTFIDPQGQFIDTVHFPPSAKKHPIRGKGVYELTGKVVEEFDFVSLEISSMNRIHYLNMEDEILKKSL